MFATGRRDDGGLLQLLYLPARQGVGRAGFAIPKKSLPLAVDRNRVRRIFREAVRAARPRVDGFDVILRLKRGCPRERFVELRAEADRLLARLPNAGATSE